MPQNTQPSPSGHVVITILSDDRPGLVETIAQELAELGGNWMESKMVRLGGQFAGLIQAQVPAGQVESLGAVIDNLQQKGIHALVQPSEDSAHSSTLTRNLRIEVLASDRPGIIRDLTRLIASEGGNIEELATDYIAAPWSGELLFKAMIKITLQTGSNNYESLRRNIEEQSEEMMFDLTFL